MGESILVVAHGGVLDGLFRRTLGIPLEAPRRFKLWNAGLNVFYYDDSGHWTLGTWGDVCHLAEIGTMDDA
jgi:probable phosphoglycerate mutase